MTVVCLVILAGIFWGDFFLKNYPELAIKVQQNKLEPLQYALNSVIKALKN